MTFAMTLKIRSVVFVNKLSSLGTLNVLYQVLFKHGYIKLDNNNNKTIGEIIYITFLPPLRRTEIETCHINLSIQAHTHTWEIYKHYRGIQQIILFL